MKKIKLVAVFDCNEAEAEILVVKMTTALNTLAMYESLADFAISVTTEYATLKGGSDVSHEEDV